MARHLKDRIQGGVEDDRRGRASAFGCGVGCGRRCGAVWAIIEGDLEKLNVNTHDSMINARSVLVFPSTHDHAADSNVQSSGPKMTLFLNIQCVCDNKPEPNKQGNVLSMSLLTSQTREELVALRKMHPDMFEDAEYFTDGEYERVGEPIHSMLPFWKIKELCWRLQSLNINCFRLSSYFAQTNCEILSVS